ncbi:MAG: DGQHR domain-containing protein [Nitrosopumilus sp.]|nr:DGQHR domain-containing protein [Nitrosopumilus sp.]MDH3488482.1 DGQHR domain-containing protein [Nitrosopumilus sp.]
MSLKSDLEKIETSRTELERKVGKLLLKMGLHYVDSDSDIQKINQQKIGEIDHIFTYDDFLFLIEVNGEKKAGSKKINDFFSKWESKDNLKLIHEKHNLGPLTPVRIYFEFDKNSFDNLSPAIEHNIKKGSNVIVYADDFEYFRKYYDKIGSWSKNDFLNFIEVKNDEGNQKLDAIQFHIGDTVVFSFVQRVDILLKSCYVSRRRDKQEGYQRTLEEGRIKSISNAIVSGKGLTFPNSILINTPTLKEDVSSPQPRPKLVKIDFPTGFCSCRIIDGQHRLLGFSQLSEDIQKRYFLPVVAVQNYDLKDEILTFIDINSKQKRVDQNLILLLISGFDWDKSKHEKEYKIKIAVEVANKLNTDYFYGNIYFGKSDETKGDKITLTTLASTLKKNNFIKEEFKDTFDNIAKVFRYLGIYLPEHSFKPKTYFGQNKGIRVLFRLLRLFYKNQDKSTVNVSLENFIKDLGGIMNLDMTKKLDSYYGEAGVNLGATDLIKSMQEKYEDKYDKMKSELVSLR